MENENAIAGRPAIPLISIQEDKCNVCYACVRVCPVKAIQVSEGEESPKIIQDRCIGCGSCISACAPAAITYRDSCAGVRELLASGGDIVAITGPSISGEYADITDYRKFVQMIKALGFKYVHGSSFGVDLVAKEYNDLFKNSKGKYYLTTTCPVVVSYIEKYHPDLVPNLAPIVSPMIAVTKVVRKKYGQDIKVVYIGPCVQNKDEALLFDDGSAPDAVITFVELRKLFAEYNISESQLEYSDFNSPIGYKGSIFPISNGLVQAAGMSEDLLTGNVITAGGKVRMLGAASSFSNHINTISCHFNMFYCDGCIMGPGTSPNGDKYLRRSLVVEYAKKRLSNFNRNAWDKNMEEYGKLGFQRNFRTDDQRLPEPDEDTIRDIMRSLDIEKPEDELGCSACGYPSCRDFAISIAQGIATPEMCNAFSTKNKQNYIRTLKLTNEKLAQMQDALQDSERLARQEQETAKEASAIISSMLQKIPNALVIVDKNLRILQSNESFIELVGDDAREINEVIPGLVGADLKTLLPHTFYNLFSYVLTSNDEVINRDVHMDEALFNISVFPIRQHSIVGAVIRDLSMPEVQKEEVINRVTDVIDKNLELVQKIGFILGEGAAETEKMLNSIIESYKGVKKK